MAVEWTWPLVTSVLRLVFISTLTVVNWAALYRVISTKKYKTGQRQERLLVTTIIVVSLVYLTIVWAPFTFSALKHDLSDLRQDQENFKTDLGSHHLPLPDIRTDLESDVYVNAFDRETEDEFVVEYIDLEPSADVIQDVTDGPHKEMTAKHIDFVSDDEDRGINDEVDEEFTVEYIDIRTGKPVRKEPQPRIARDAGQQMEGAWTVFFHSQPQEGEEDTSLSPVKKDLTPNAETMSKGRANSLYWNSDVQDLVTSSCAYSLAFTAVVRMVIMRRFVLCPDGPLVLGIWSGLVVGVPGAITLLIRTLGKTTGHFAPHQPEYTATGYFLYNIICDVHISEEYVISVFLEWAALFTLLLIVLAVIFAVASKTNQGDPTDSYGRLQDEGISSSSSNSNNSNVEAWARDVVLMVGAIWSWPIKPVVVLILFCTYGSHWTNVVCWVAHVVVAIPVVFIPLAVFLSRPHAEKSPMDVYVIEEDPNLSGDTSQNLKKEKEEEEEGKSAKQEEDAVGKVQNDNNLEGQLDNDRGHGHAKENLKFYLGKDIFKYGLKPKSKEEKEDKKIILENEWGDTNFGEA